MLRTAGALQSVIESWIVGETLAGRKAGRGIRRQHTELQVTPQIVIPSPKIVLRELCGEKNGSKRPIFCKLVRNFVINSLQVCSRGPSWGSCTTPYEDSMCCARTAALQGTSTNVGLTLRVSCSNSTENRKQIIRNSMLLALSQAYLAETPKPTL